MTKIINFLRLITSNLIGLLVGLVVAGLIIIIFQFTICKGSKVNGFISFILCLIFAFAGVFIQNKFFNKTLGSAPTPQEQITSIDVNISNGWKNTNGGFNFAQIMQSQKDTNCPTREDQIINLKCHDFGSYVCFSFKDNDIYQNIVFLKTSNGLVVDGILNMTAEFPIYFDWWLRVDFNNFKWYDHREKEPYYYKNNNLIEVKYENLVSVSRQMALFLEREYPFWVVGHENVNYQAMQQAAIFTANNATDHFIKFGDVELIGTKDTGMIKINSFYNYLYEQIKGIGYNNSKIVDATSSLCLPIPQEEQKNYPIPASEKTNYATNPTDITTAPDYYGVYRTNIAVDLEFVKGNSILNETPNTQEYIKKISEDKKTQDKIKVETVVSNNNFSKLHINFKNTKDNAITNVNLKQNPIKIQFTCEELNLSKMVEINSFEKLEKGMDCIFNKNVTWKYQIDSSELIFENFMGSFKLEDNSNDVCFDYYYLENFVVANVGLNPVKTIDESTIDLSANPVKIILSNSKHTYQFVFDSNDKLNAYESMVIEVGEYDYTILSKQLIFASVSGKLTITTTDRTMLFNYALNLDKNDLDFTINISNSSGTTGRFNLYSASSNVDLIRNELGGDKVYKVNCYIYDNAGKLMETFSHTHSGSGTCGDSWTAQNLTIGQTYTMQLRFTDSSDTTKTYLSDISDFVYNSSITYKITYNVTKV